MTPAEALAELRESRDGALLWHDNGAMVTRLAREAGVRVEYVYVDLTALTVGRHVRKGRGCRGEQTWAV